MKPTCYMCNKTATSREHFPPKSFFPKSGRVRSKLRTVPSCDEHNGKKSSDDQYLLAHICIHAASGENLAKTIFWRSIAPHLSSKRFKTDLVNGAQPLPDRTVAYKVDVARIDSFFDHLSCALYFDRYKTSLNPGSHLISHAYLSLVSQDPHEQLRNRLAATMMEAFISNFNESVAHYEAAKADESIYHNKIIDPAGVLGSITIMHTFYGVFNVVSFLSKQGVIGEP